MKRILFILLLSFLCSTRVQAQSVSPILPDSATTIASRLNDPLHRLRLTIAGMKLRLPQDKGNGIRYVDIKLENNNIVFVFSVDDKQTRVSELAAVKKELRESIIASYLNTSQTRILLELCTEVNHGIIYQYYGSLSLQRLSINIPAEEIKGLLNGKK